MKMSFLFIFRRRLHDVLIKTNIFALVISPQEIFKTFSSRLAKTSSRRSQDVFKTSCKNVFKTSSKRLQDILKTSSRHLEDTFKASCKNVFKKVSRCIISLNCFPRSRICLGHTSEKFMASAENLQVL